MQSKHSRAYSSKDLPPSKRLRQNIADLYASNQLSANRAQELFEDAAAAGAADCRILTRRPATKKNIARDLRRRLLKNTQWPDDYVAPIRVWNPKATQEEVKGVSLLLPHECLSKMADLGSQEGLFQREGLDLLSRQHLEKCEALAGCPLLPLGLWGNGAPCNWDRTESLEIFTFNFPGFSGEAKSFRIPICGLSRKNIGPHTFDDLLSVVVWSLESLAGGHWPRARHDASAWGISDARRARKAGEPLGLRGVLVEIRGDWKFYKEVFRFPG
jgi:hypothetical protein